jgi:hypothetical protein
MSCNREPLAALTVAHGAIAPVFAQTPPPWPSELAQRANEEEKCPSGSLFLPAACRSHIGAPRRKSIGRRIVRLTIW